MTVATLSFRPLMVATLAVAVLASSGCSWIRNKWGNEAEYQASRQNQPLEVPPGLDVPSTAGAVTVPDANPNAPRTAVAEGVPSSAGQAYVEGIESFTLADSVASSYRRIGIALAPEQAQRLSLASSSTTAWASSTRTSLCTTPKASSTPGAPTSTT